MHDAMDDGKRPDRLDLLLTDYFRPEMAAADLPRRIAAAARESDDRARSARGAARHRGDRAGDLAGGHRAGRASRPPRRRGS